MCVYTHMFECAHVCVCVCECMRLCVSLCVCGCEASFVVCVKGLLTHLLKCNTHKSLSDNIDDVQICNDALSQEQFFCYLLMKSQLLKSAFSSSRRRFSQMKNEIHEKSKEADSRRVATSQSTLLRSIGLEFRFLFP